MRPRLLAIIVPVALLVLAGCTAAPANVARASHPGTPDGFDTTSNVLNGEPGALWIGGRAAFAIVTYGSATCAPIPTAISSPDAHTISVTFVKAPSGGCVAELAAMTREFDIPEGVDVDNPVTLNITYDFDQDYSYTLTLE
jgi:hypothetical protein